MGQLIALQRTTPSQIEFHHAIVESWNAVTSDVYPCNAMIAALLFGQFAFETGWGRSCWNWNLGNHRTGALKPPSPTGWDGDYVELKTADEYINGQRVIVGGYFRAYGLRDDSDGLIRGAVGHIQFLLGLKHYARAAAVLRACSGIASSSNAAIIAAGEFVDELKAGGYFTGPLDTYRRGVQSIARDYVKLPFVTSTSVDEYDVEATPVLRPDDYRFGIPGPDPSLNSFNAMDALDSIFGWDPGEYDRTDNLHLALVTACRFDCEVPV